MRFIQIEEYDHHTMQLARPIYDRMKRVLLAAGRTIHPKYLERIKQMNISTLIVEDAESHGITMEELLDMPTWMDAIEVVQKAYELAKQNKQLNVFDLQVAINKIIFEVTRRKTIFLIPSSSVTEELKPYAHAVNVTLLALQTSKQLGYTNSQQRDLAMGTMLHDIGKMRTNDISLHPEQGFQLIRKNREISLLSAHVAFQHHEHFDGTGLPRKLSGADILEFPQICAVSDFYEHLTSNGEALPHLALEMIMAKNSLDYNPKVVQAFIDSVPSYIPGTKVRLSSGEEAIVIRIENNLHRPVVRIKNTGAEVDLSENVSILISEILQ
ncbi:HD domain-containing phosphohydrolase [Bacillus sp. FJAT-49736]|uniref:HD-GYP domain-containing protein n=1 Tax=Bacillus sp. FJAT-49736 TaxID=2833582 RepID=UPI001BC9069D|nr:HD domain-containing phosphohydrolase [Bacillus sp. FJAT-49736]MBS4174176.1 HD domain-containing protein [Bacillus sp. FJAT-49736]